MKLAIAVQDLSKETLLIAKQLGVTHLDINGNIFLDKNLKGPLQLSKLKKAKELVESNGLKIEVVLLPQEENSQFWNVKLGKPERDKEIKDVCQSIKNLSKVGIPIAEYVFNLIGILYAPGSIDAPMERGGAITRHFDWNIVKDKKADPELKANSEEMWDRITYFLKYIVPVAEASGIRLAAHPDDPPVSPLKGDPRILGSLEGMKRLIEVVPSEVNGLSFCQGTVAEMGVDVIEAIRYFGSRDKINHVHFRNIRGSVPLFDETFIDNGDVDMVAAMRAYKEVGYKRTIIPDHCPWVSTDPTLLKKAPWPMSRVEKEKHISQDLGKVFTIGYMKALMQVIDT